MAESDERSPSGAPILRHTASAPSDDVAHADDERIANHLSGVLGGESMVFHELVSDRVHIDVHMFAPTPERQSFVLATSGMSARAMTMPAGFEQPEQWCFGELMMILPPTWKLAQRDFDDERNYWPVRLLKMLARLPHEYATWLGWGHTIPNGDPARPYAPGTELCGAMVIPPFAFGRELFEVPGEPIVHVYQVLPLTAAEMDFKLRSGVDALLERMEAADDDIYGPLDAARRSLV